MRKCSIAPGKVILLGEHFVVKGKPALGLAVSLYAKVCVVEGNGEVRSRQLGLVSRDSRHWPLFGALFRAVGEKFGNIPPVDVEVDSEIPLASGMGSSASVAVALAHALLSYMNVEFTREDVWRIASEAEKAVHFRPSGVDTTLATHGGFLYYKQGVFKRLEITLPRSTTILVVNTRVERSTGEVVRDVLERYTRLKEVCEHIYNAAEVLVERAVEALRVGDVRVIGELMLVNHGLLWAMGASSYVCDKVVYELVERGALGAKVSGAGRGGVVVGIASSSDAEGIVAWFRKMGYECFTVTPDYEGVRGISS